MMAGRRVFQKNWNQPLFSNLSVVAVLRRPAIVTDKN